ncbi:hypothetical protein EDD65_104159 [Keratinibaculum paraultunense]|uniref:AAA domain-containing protein n=1 Tax=Keratinibaculum paraultunense TaxID=1278232 RepID=A0A4R3KZV9_9FIRM|nr:hypothetical protein [Keratinibaculum paraultunense]QQY78994.1 hypothetical protein JL105_07300 [Keratinibaculum paraultunense]TCS90616.1 hypothetical protein EDD65_104159 [Keratinibaculum paraultunense]
MVKFILGPKGSGKTKWLIDQANEDIKEGNGNIIFVDVDDNHIFNLNYAVRLINAMEFNINNIESFYGFLCGIIGRDYDVEKIYVDSIYKIIPLEMEDLKRLKEDLELISEKFETEFYINVEYMLEDMPDDLKENCIELGIE